MDYNDEKLVQIYAQQCHHGSSYIVGNLQGLKELRDAIDEAIRTGQSDALLCPSDNELYDVKVRMLNADEAEKIELIQMPYTEQYGPKNENFYYEHKTDDPKAPYPPSHLFK
ncbi:hypothetical protein [Terribacillus saccharophilus]|uniref:Uncharacterized protein n=1 Tax=Terribacillus saccharophilus TaxID=361277 RepID=A0ABX4H0S5_9BACI|nr:hypothetical protein [Terribacillus saccharophilus]PAD33798.1 hypothetical protein CHH56_17850 [Terribacillus saccharophilus]PAD95001.1 hypothetical protein CHH50_15455 [Terribacillus saccharophilus]PAE00732.1 hypothetical protein CHH48_05740 [Terribacillus saccharophilus]